jgi:hypothetical protein
MRVSEIKAQCTTTTLTTAATTITLLKNGVATALTVTFPAGTTGEMKAVGNVDFADDDRWDMQITTVAGGAGTATFSVTMVCQPVLP